MQTTTTRLLLHHLFLILILYFSAYNHSLYSQNRGKWVEGAGEVVMAENMTAAEAKQLARARARTNAIEKALGISVSAGQFLQQFEVMRESGEIIDAGDSFTRYIHESRRGRIIEEGKWQEETRVSHSTDGTEIIKRIAKNRFHVVAEEKKADPSFQLNLKLPKKKYTEGEALSFEVLATKTCYLNVFNLSGNDTLYLMFPNILEKSNRLLQTKSRHIPGADYSFTTTLPAGKDISVEYIIAVASRDSMVFRSTETITPGSGYAQTFKAGLNDVWKWIAEIDADKRVEAIESFNIYKK